ncbi:MAG: M48 family metallopeptidase [Chloroflexi bacterium]|nr:M48 family metallopeptidase [Chloroflexota bacterium]
MYGAIEANKRRTILFIAVLTLLPAVVAELFGLAIGLPFAPATVVAALAAAVALAIGVWGYRSGDSLVLSVSEARPADRQQHPRLYRTVENLCIGAGLPMPRVYVIDDGALNAFATGRDPQHASITVTAGLLQKLEDLELEGVIAHELSHVRNYDIRLMLITAVLVGVIAMMADIFLRSTWYGAGARRRYRGKGEDAGGALLLALAVAAMIIAPLVAIMVQMAVSRQREYLADAAGALLTRYPAGLAGALEKIAGDKDPLDVNTKGTAHLYIAEPFKGQASAMNRLFDTHPPIGERIRRLRAMGG